LRNWLAKEKSGQREDGSIVADPLFQDADRYDFRIGDNSPAIAEIAFDHFEPSEAGLVGDAEWTSLPGKLERPAMTFWSERSRDGETDRLRAGFTP